MGKGEREREREKHGFGAPLVYAFTGFLYVLSPGIEPITLAYQDEALTK